jgi:hypothetical protein
VSEYYVAWCRSFFDMLSDGGVWGVPRSAVMFQKRGEKLVLIDRMPYDPAMPITERELREQQDAELAVVSEWFGKAGIEVLDGTT